MKKTIIGIMIMAVAIMMTLSSAVFAANAITTTVSGDVKVGETVTVTVNHPAGTSAGEYVVTYDADKLTYAKNNDDATETTAGQIKVVFMDMNYKEVKSEELKFTAKAEGAAKVEVKNVTLSNTDGKEIADVTATGATVKVVKEETPVTPVEPSNPGTAGESTTPTTPTTPSTDNKDNTATDKKDDGDKTLTTLKETKTGFDAMYIVYLAAAVLVAGGIVTVAKRK